MRIFALDPGKLTGAVILNWDGSTVGGSPDMLVDWCEIRFDEDRLPHWLEYQISVADQIVYEKFILSPRTIQYTRQPEPLHIIGATVVLARKHEKPVREQTAAAAKGAYSDARLKPWGLTGHARDALRHALLATHSLIKTGR